MLHLALALLAGGSSGAPSPLPSPNCDPVAARASLRADLRAELDTLVAKRFPSGTPGDGASLRADVQALFARHVADDGSPVEIAGAWTGWTRGLVTLASDPATPAAESDRALALLAVACDLAFDVDRSYLVVETVRGTLQGALAPTLDAALATNRDAAGTNARVERHLAPLRAVTARASEAARPTLATLAADTLARALTRGRDDLVAALLDGRLAPLHGELRETFLGTLGEDERSLVLFERHRETLAVAAEPLTVTRARLARAGRDGDWRGATTALARLVEFEALSPAVEASAFAPVPDAVRAAIDGEGALPVDLAGYLTALAALPGGAERVDGARDAALRASLTEALSRKAPAAIVAGRLERASALGAPMTRVLQALDACAETSRSLEVAALDALGRTRPGDIAVRQALDSALERAAVARDLETLEAASSLGPEHAEGFVTAFRRVDFVAADGVGLDARALDLYLTNEALLAPALTPTQRTALETVAAEHVARRRMALALAAGDSARVLELAASGANLAAVADAWAHVTTTLAAEGGADADVTRAANLARELGRLGYTAPAEVAAALQARVARAVDREPSELSAELARALGVGVVDRDTLRGTVTAELQRGLRKPTDVWARLDVTRRALGLDWSAFTAEAEALASRALIAGEDPLVDQMARVPALADGLARAFARWYEERVYTGQELHRGVILGARGVAAYPAALPPGLVSDGRLGAAVRTAFTKSPPDVDLEELAIEHGVLIGLTQEERLTLSRASLRRARLETADLAERVARHASLAGVGQELEGPVYLRASFLVAVQSRDWDAALPRLAAARKANALTAADAPVVAAVEGEVARREAELQEYRALSLLGTWNVAFFVDGRREQTIQRAELMWQKEGAADFLRCKLSGAGGELAKAFSALYDPRKKTLALKFDRNVKLETSVKPVLQMAGSLRLLEPKGTAFEWTLDGPAGAPKLSMIWTRE